MSHTARARRLFDVRVFIWKKHKNVHDFDKTDFLKTFSVATADYFQTKRSLKEILKTCFNLLKIL